MQPSASELEQSTIRKLDRRIIFIPFILAVVSFIDRVNISYAALQMNSELGLTVTTFALGAGILFVGYCLFEIPSNLVMQKVGARRWLARIAITWGLVTMGMAFVGGIWSFYTLRFLLGVAEAGLFPGVYLYLTYWYPDAHRGKANALFLTCIPIAVIVSAPLSAWLVSFDKTIMNLSGWQLMFLVEGAPAILLGFIVLACLPDRPRDVAWLSPAEKAWLTDTLEREVRAASSEGRHDFGYALRSPTVWGFVIAYFCYACGSYGLTLFLPQILAQLKFTTLQTGFVGALPYIAGLIAMVANGKHSDATGERRWHFALPMLIAAAGLWLAGMTMAQPQLALVFLTVAGAGLYASLAAFWARPMAFLVGTAAAAGIALINSLGNIGGFAGPYMVGYLKSATGDYSAGLIVLAGLLAAGAVIWLLLRDRPARAS
ncbi:MFS transporter [Phreatobacter sp. AB_2022a]|uniref:MFS transporter n=1 Tax=Phreatobacter sp. AB_2022a TaxID=3003134 RepID=UPI002286F73A|nr:MFS transporter [Phreatobacter sp. AB_2022a]MCZ0737232.1 MFS transporter [Phreatobacter sp. AB_2022a]